MYPADVSEKNLRNVVNILKKDHDHGISCNNSYKEKIIKYLDKMDSIVKK